MTHLQYYIYQKGTKYIDRKTDGREKMRKMKKRKRDKMDGRGEPKRPKQKEHDSQNSDRVENH